MSEKETLVGISVKIRPDQSDYLKAVRNRSEWIRSAIDMKISTDAAGGDEGGAMGKVHRVEALEKKKRLILTSSVYQRIMRVRNGSIVVEEYKPIRLASDEGIKTEKITLKALEKSP